MRLAAENASDSLAGLFALTVDSNFCEDDMPLDRNLTLPVHVEPQRC